MANVQSVGKSVVFSIETEIPEKTIPELIQFIVRKYVNLVGRFTAVSTVTVNGAVLLSFMVLNKEKAPVLLVEVVGGNPIVVSFTWIGEASDKMVDTIHHDLTAFVRIFEERVRKSTLVLAWREGKTVTPEKHGNGGRKTIGRSFLELQIILSAVFIGASIFFFILFDWLAPILLILTEFFILFLFGSIIASRADWRITADEPCVSLVKYRLPLGEEEVIREKYPESTLKTLKNEVYDHSEKEVNCEAVQKVLNAHGFNCSPQDLTVKKIDVYALVKKVADQFGFKTPQIVVANMIDANAAATGVSVKHGTVLITTGILDQLSESELSSVLGHELGHLKGHDPLWLYGLTSFEYLFRFYVLLQLFPIFFTSILLFSAYFFASMSAIFFVAKFFEARADLVSSMVMGEPEALATALEKIGFKKLLMEQTNDIRFFEWTGFDPHPPILFRINRLRKLKVPVKSKHPLIQSIKEVINGLRESLKRKKKK